MISEYEKFFKDEFFVIDSNNLNNIEDKLYGFMLNGGKVIQNDNLSEMEEITTDGTYVYIKNDLNHLTIFQDYGGNYGLYIFKDENYFAISNSFLKLEEYLKNNHNLTLNEDYASYFITASMCAAVYGDTLINEIETIPHNRIIKINKNDKTIHLEKIDYKRHSINLDSKEGLEILDNWYYKWVDIVRSLKEKTNNIQFDLSGGYDSRLILLLLLGANVDLEKVSIMSFNDNEICHDEDYEIAMQIANDFNFKLNNKVISAEKIEFKDINTPIAISFYTKLGFSNQLAFQLYRTKESVFRFSGFAGETVRDNNFGTPFGYLKQTENTAKRIDPMFQYPSKRILKLTYKKLAKEYNISEDLNIMNGSYLFINSISRNHYCKFATERYFSNELMIVPLFDKYLQMLTLNTEGCLDENLLMAVIFDRYCPKLLEYKFERNRKINDDTIDYAMQINEKFPFSPKRYEFISGPEINSDKVNKYYESKNNVFGWEEEGKYIKRKDVDNYLESIYRSKFFMKEFEKYYPKHVYDDIVKTFEKNYFPLQHAYPLFSIIKIITDIQYSRYHNSFGLNDWLETFEEYNNRFFNKSIFDIRKLGLFDDEFYLNQLHTNIEMDPLTHYLEIGYKEGKNPSKLFDGNYYLKKNPDVKKRNINPLLHYISYGIVEDRISKPILEECPIDLRLVPMNKIKDVLDNNISDEDLNLYLTLSYEIKKLQNIKNILEIKPFKCPIIERGDILDIEDWNIDEYPIVINNFIKHDFYKFPYPIIDKKYDLVISYQSIGFLSKDIDLINFFNEMERISKKLIIVCTDKVIFSENNDIIDESFRKFWTYAQVPKYQKEFDGKILQVYEFKS